MSVNERWSGSSDRCPVCLNCREDWKHHLQCQSQDMKRKKDEILSNFDMDLLYFKTYPPLQEFIIDFFESFYKGETLECPDTLDPSYMIELQLAYKDQSSIGWDNFATGLLS